MQIYKKVPITHQHFLKMPEQFNRSLLNMYRYLGNKPFGQQISVCNGMVMLGLG